MNIHKYYRKLTTTQDPGFTLVELLLGMAIFSALIVVVIGLQSLLIHGEEFGFSTALTVENAEASLQTLVTELRKAKTSDVGSYALEKTADQEIVFYANIDDEDDIERVRYFLEGTELKKGVIKPTDFPVSYPLADEKVKTVSQYVQNNDQPLFYYYNQNWPQDTVNNPLSQPVALDEVTLVKIRVIINSQPSQPQREFVLEPFVQIRSLKTNL